MKIFSNRVPNPKQLVAYLGIGLLTTAIDAIITFLLFEFLGFSVFLASAVGFLSGFFVNFPLNKNKVFFSSNGQRFKVSTQVQLYVLLIAFNLFSTSFAVALLVDLGIQIVVAKFFVTGVLFIWNFVVFKFYIFRPLKS
jgi:putative flippase GtrA